MRTKLFGIFAATIALVSVPAISFACACSQITDSMIWSTPKPDDYKPGLAFLDTPEYRHEFESAVEGAKAACQKHIGERNLAIVADIDETIVDNREDYVKNPKWSIEAFNAWVREARAPVLKPTADFLDWARHNGFAVFLITGRREDLRAATIENLVRDKIAYDGLYMKPMDCKDQAQVFKPQFRKQIEDMGFKVIVSIGDQYSDLVGGHAEDCEKLPNKMYRVP